MLELQCLNCSTNGTLLSPAVHEMLLTCETIYWLSKGVSKNLSGEGDPDFDGKSKEIFFYNFYTTSNRHSCFCKNFDVR